MLGGWAGAVGGIVLTTLLGGVGVAPADATAEWRGDGRSWNGTGSVIVPGAGYVGHRPSSPAGCADCHWWVKPACDRHSIEPICGAWDLFICSTRTRLYFTMFASSEEDPRVVASSCIGPADRPVSQQELERTIADHVKAQAPALRPGFQPSAGAVTQIATVFRSGQPAMIEHEDTVAGFSLRLQARAHWHWVWGDGDESDVSRPGGVWPDVSVTHTYRQPARAQVIVSARWDAQYWVDGAGPFRVGGDPVTQSASVPVHVRQARAVLTG